MLRDSVVAVAVIVVRTRPRAIPLAMTTMRKSTHGFHLFSYMSMGLRLATLQAAGTPLLIIFPYLLKRFFNGGQRSACDWSKRATCDQIFLAQ